MHEMSLCENLIQIIEQQALEQQFSQVSTVVLELGVFSGVEPDALQFCFDICCRGTIADASKLVIVQLPAYARCLDCNKTVLLPDRLACCPDCQGWNLEHQGGKEMRIKQMEVS